MGDTCAAERKQGAEAMIWAALGAFIFTVGCVLAIFGWLLS